MQKKVLVLVFIFFFIIISASLYGFYKKTIAVPKVSLHQVIMQALRGAKGKYSVVVKNFKTGEEYHLYDDKVYLAGSLYKLWIMAAVFDQIQNGELSEDNLLEGDVEILNKRFGISKESAEMTEGKVILTVKDALKQMITISHNYASLLLSDRVKLSNVRLFLEKYGFKQSIIGDDLPSSTPYDIAFYLEKLYKGELANAEYTSKMIDLLKMQKLNDKLPKYLPQGTVIAHKTGEIDFLTHDGGIVYTPSGDYIIVVFSESNYPPGAKERIAQISRAVYDYFVKSD